jgi:fatty-acyl-CoA synthase
VLLAHPAVSEAAVFGIPHEDWGEAVTAVVILREGWSGKARAPVRREAEELGMGASGFGRKMWPEPIQRDAREFSSDDLVEHCRRQLAAFKVPKFLGFAQDFPRNAGGKVMKGELARMLLGGG